MKNNMNIFRQYFFAITNPKKYSEMTRLGGGRVFLYMLLLSIVTTFITLAGPVTTYFKSGGATKVIDEYLPEFRLDNNSFTTTLKYNGVFDMDDFIYVDDPEQMLTSKDIAEEIRPYLIYILAEDFHSQVKIYLMSSLNRLQKIYPKNYMMQNFIFLLIHQSTLYQRQLRKI